MIKNIIFDIGGIILDDSVENLSKIFSKDMSKVYKKIYSGNFKKCLLGNLSITEYVKEFENDKDYKYISEILEYSKQKIMMPVITENLEYISNLKNRGYHIYILSNLTEETYDYLNSIIDINKYFDGSVFSFKVGIRKPDKEIFNLIVNRYSLNINETIFFDDKEIIVNEAIKSGLKAKIFRCINDVEIELIK